MMEEESTCETRSLLRHDLLHYAVEAEAKLEDGFWGNLARGRRVDELGTMADGGPELLAIERLVGALDSAAKGLEAAAVVAAVGEWKGNAFRRLDGAPLATGLVGAMKKP